jgi:hypothetical protein
VEDQLFHVAESARRYEHPGGLLPCCPIFSHQTTRACCACFSRNVYLLYVYLLGDI